MPVIALVTAFYGNNNNISIARYNIIIITYANGLGPLTRRSSQFAGQRFRSMLVIIIGNKTVPTYNVYLYKYIIL